MTLPRPAVLNRPRPVLLHTLHALGLSVLLMAGTPALAQTASAAQRIQLPAQDLGKALLALGEQTQLQIFFSQDVVRGLQAPAVNAVMPAEQALTTLLQGTNIQFRRSGNNIVLSKGDDTAQLDVIRVQASREQAHGPVQGYVATRSATGTKTDTSLMETAQSVSVITRDRMEAQGAQTVSDGLSYSAGVYSNVAGDNPADNTVMVRGFQQITANAYTDGLRNNQVGYYALEPFGMERLEVLKGPASVLYGQGSPGGTVNVVSKLPTFSSFRRLGVSGGSHNRLQATVDLGDVWGESDQFSYRLVGLVRRSDAAVDYLKDDRVYLAPSFSWSPSAATSLTVLASYQRNNNLFTTNLPYAVLDGSNPNGKVPRSRSLNEPGFDDEKGEQSSIGYRFEHAFNEQWSVKQNFRYSHFKGHENQLMRNSALIGDSTIGRFYNLRQYDSDMVAVDNQLVGKLQTGPLAHTLLVGVDYQHSKRNIWSQTGPAPNIDIYKPVRGVTIDTTRINSQMDTAEKQRQLGLYLQDQIRLDRWALNLGGRYDWSRQTTENLLKNTTQQTDADDFTGRAGFGYVFDSGWFPYVSYSNSFSPTSGTDINGTAFKPETARQYEVGVKYQPAGWNGHVTLAAFDLRRQNVLTTNPQNTSFSVQEGEVKSRGVELEAVLEPTENLNLILAYSYNDVEVSKDNPNFAGVSNLGKAPVRVPKHLASAWADYTWKAGALRGLTVGGGVRYTGTTFGDAQNTFKVPHYTLFDAMLRYDFGQSNAALRGLSASLHARNLGNKYYVAGCFLNSACLLGAGRTVTANLNYQW